MNPVLWQYFLGFCLIESIFYGFSVSGKVLFSVARKYPTLQANSSDPYLDM